MASAVEAIAIRQSIMNISGTAITRSRVARPISATWLARMFCTVSTSLVQRCSRSPLSLVSKKGTGSRTSLACTRSRSRRTLRCAATAIIRPRSRLSTPERTAAAAIASAGTHSAPRTASAPPSAARMRALIAPIRVPSGEKTPSITACGTSGTTYWHAAASACTPIAAA